MAKNREHKSDRINDGSGKRDVPDRGVRAIAIFKFIKGVLLIILGSGALKLLHRDVPDVALSWLNALHVPSDNRYLQPLLAKIMFIDESKIKELSAGSFFYAGIVLTEGFGLWLQKTWGEYVTIVATGIFIPLELYEIVKRVSVARILLTIVNILVVVYLVIRLKRKSRAEQH
jgi:uncharacterized membrane protein (DUF2068 family)